MLVHRGRGSSCRKELTDLEQFVLIQIFDQSWKDHLYAMDMLKSGIGLQAFAEQDPRIVYKKEGYRYFEEMMAGIRDKVTDLIFRARVGRPDAGRAAPTTRPPPSHEDAGGYGVGENVARDRRRGRPTAPPAARRAGRQAGARATARRSRRSSASTPKVGRNDPCPCGSGKKYKKCCGANAA